MAVQPGALRSLVIASLAGLAALIVPACGGTTKGGPSEKVGPSGYEPGDDCTSNDLLHDECYGTCSCVDGTWTCERAGCEADGGMGVSPDWPCAPGATRPSEDGCNSCTCTEGGWACTKRACPTACDEGTATSDGCNECKCSGGNWICTDVYCPPQICTPGEVMEQQCGTCTCAADGTAWQCPLIGCPQPVCKEGDKQRVDCNECTCMNGQWGCTTMLCPLPEPECKDGEPVQVGCNTCSCVNGRIAACTERACPPEQDAGSAPRGCGGWLGPTCTESEYCAYEEGQYCGQADASSVCKPRPVACDGDLKEVCGCDFVTYPNACTAAAKGQGVYTTGPCPVRD